MSYVHTQVDTWPQRAVGGRGFQGRICLGRVVGLPADTSAPGRGPTLGGPGRAYALCVPGSQDPQPGWTPAHHPLMPRRPGSGVGPPVPGGTAAKVDEAEARCPCFPSTMCVCSDNFPRQPIGAGHKGGAGALRELAGERAVQLQGPRPCLHTLPRVAPLPGRHRRGSPCATAAVPAVPAPGPPGASVSVPAVGPGEPPAGGPGGTGRQPPAGGRPHPLRPAVAAVRPAGTRHGRPCREGGQAGLPVRALSDCGDPGCREDA